MERWLIEVKEERQIPAKVVREAEANLVAATDAIEASADESRSVACALEAPSVLLVAMCMPWALLTRKVSRRPRCCCRAYEPLEAVGLIFHKAELVGACSEQNLAKAFKALLKVLATTKDKV